MSDNLTMFIDASSVGSFTQDSSGFLSGNAFILRSGIQRYTGSEVGRADLEYVDVYRDEADVFKVESLDTFAGMPITIGHPEGGVNSENWRDLAVGQTGGEVLRDKQYLKIGLKIMDANAVSDVNNGLRELSAGYLARLVWGDGVSEDGKTYQAKQVDIVANHLAIVKKGRAGYKARIGDQKNVTTQINDEGIKKMTVVSPLATVVLGDSGVQVPLESVGIIDRYKVSQAKAIADTDVKHKSEIDAKDVEIAKKDAEIKKLTDAALSETDLSKLVESRSSLIAAARSINKDIKIDGISDADIRKSVVVSKYNDAEVAGKSDAYVEARFDVIVGDAKRSQGKVGAVVSALAHIADGSGHTSSADAYTQMLNDMRTGNQPAQKGA